MAPCVLANQHILQEIGGQWHKASVRGVLYKQGWGAALGYPGIKLDDKGELVPGYLFTSEKLDQYWSMLDDFEGEGYQRQLTQIQLENGDKVKAYIYSLTDQAT